ncbi:DNA primase small subunit PriS [Thermoplasma volcanium]|uniref:DNA primase small subunit PriS n=1 Tax=Thermoplasma volcanium TaxID=50339 RepID=UPI0012EA24E3|nr:DNA primase small subunit PriS [Thermoplasma volcanium]
MSEEKLKLLFEKYYRSTDIDPPALITKREVGFMTFEGEIIRHMHLSNKFELNNMLRTTVPRHVYSSAAYYKKPDEKKMPEKIWEGADLIFDLDSDHLPGAEKMTYEEMLNSIKEQTKRLVNKFLVSDLGISEKDIRIYFSGSRGYHVHVSSEDVYPLGSDARREITDYVSGNSLSISVIDKALKTGEKRPGGWIKDVISKLYELGINAEKISQKQIERAIDQVKSHNATMVDAPVTYDIHRLIRMPQSLHGKSGMMVKEVDLDKFDDFDPLSDAIPKIFLEGDYDINVHEKTRKLRLLDYKIDLPPGRNRVPQYVAIFLVSSGRADFL